RAAAAAHPPGARPRRRVPLRASAAAPRSSRPGPSRIPSRVLLVVLLRRALWSSRARSDHVRLISDGALTTWQFLGKTWTVRESDVNHTRYLRDGLARRGSSMQNAGDTAAEAPQHPAQPPVPGE